MSRLLALVETGAMEPDAPELKDRLVALRVQKAELDRDIVRLQEKVQSGHTVQEWRPLRDSNPCRRRERAVS